MNFSTTMTVGWCNRPATTKKLLKFNQKENVPIQVDLATKWDQMMKFAHVHKELIHPNVTNVCLVSGLTQVCIAAIICHNDELSLSWLDLRGVYLCLILEMSIWEFITNSKENRFQIKLDFFVEFELDFYCLCSLQKSISKSNWFLNFLNSIFRN